MKGFFPIAIEAALAFRGARLREPLILVATADEESSMDGANMLVATGKPRARHAVIGEPTDLKPVRMHKGMMMEAVTVTGRSGHSSNPALGRNALEGMQQVMADLLAFRDELAARHRNPLFEVEVPTLNLGCIHGGDNPNRICAHCEMQHDIRVIPGLDVDQVRGELHRRVLAAIAGLELVMEAGPLHEPVPPFETEASADIVRAAEELTGPRRGLGVVRHRGTVLQRRGHALDRARPRRHRRRAPAERAHRARLDPTRGGSDRTARRTLLSEALSHAVSTRHRSRGRPKGRCQGSGTLERGTTRGPHERTS
jgi:hypothetical protein